MILHSSSNFDSILKIEGENYWNLIKTFYSGTIDFTHSLKNIIDFHTWTQISRT